MRNRLGIAAILIGLALAAVLWISGDRGREFRPSEENRDRQSLAVEKVQEVPVRAHGLEADIPHVRVNLRDARNDRALEDGTVCIAQDGPFAPSDCYPANSSGEVLIMAPRIALQFRIWGSAPGYVAASMPDAPASAISELPKEGIDIDLRLHQAKNLVNGVVVDASGGPIAGARIELLLSSERQNLCLSDENGRFSCAASDSSTSATLHVTAEGYSDTVQLVAFPVGDLRLSLFAESSLSGIVTDEAGNPVPDANVASKISVVQSRPWPQDTTSDSHGRFRLANLRPGDYQLIASAPHYSAEEEPLRVSVGYAEHRDDLVLRMKKGRLVRIFIGGEEGIRVRASR
ncbi:carboxypeptidase-like regulatory domain-containing protein [Nannocystis pusilla]|uniref:carboxypeptidase-like regulatory domain-containing protein n=1 Tax=Nannocystis pusilla TaxID=889268 RepID=UPI003B7881B6